MNRASACLTALILMTMNPWLGLAAEKDPLNIEEGVLDVIHLKVQTIEAGVPILIRPFSTEGVEVGTGGEDAKNEQRSEATRIMAKIAPDLLIEAFKTDLLASKTFSEVLPADATALPDKALVIEGRFTRIDPGSKAKRFWAGFGAGKSGVQVQGTVKDSKGAPLAEFTHMRNSGIGLGGGDYVKFLSDDAKDVGRDIALFLTTWATGGNLHED